VSTIFISHSSRDNELARELERRLARMGHPSVFLDLDPEKGIVAGQSWERTLYRKLRACRAVVALCTDAYLASHWCFAEIALARMEGKAIFAFKADPLGEKARLPSILTESQYIDLRTDREDAYRRLERGLDRLNVLGVDGDWDPKKPPYLGLAAYQEDDAPVFFGREGESRSGIELLERGAPDLIMVLGASGSGKSSLVRAGMLPMLRREIDRWLIVDPMRPGRNPFAELAQSLASAWKRYALDQASRAGDWQRIRDRLEAGSSPGSPPVQADAPRTPVEDERVRRLISQLEDLRENPPSEGGGPLLEFLDWSLDDLRRVFWGGPGTSDAARGTSTGADALVEMADELRRASGRRDAQVLIVVDQFEEALGARSGRERAQRFLSMLRASLEVAGGPLACLGTMRSDFLGAFQRDPALRGIDFESLSLGPMRIDGMRRVIEEPARLAAIELETGLVDRMIADAETPDALPLLSFTLWRMWRDFRQDGKFALAEYENLGGLEGAMVREADAVLAEARREHVEDDLRRALIRMARLTEDGQYARRPVRWDVEEIQRARPLLERLVKRRLLVSRMEGDASIVEVAHEALFRSWAPLRGWLDNNRSELLLRQQIARDAKAWEEGGRSADLLWRGGRLRLAEDLVKKGASGEKKSPEQVFVEASARRRTALRTTLVASLAVVFAVVTGLLVKTLISNALIKDEKARSQDLARISISEHMIREDPTIAALVLLEVDRPGRLGFGLTSEMLDSSLATNVLHHDGEVIDAAIAPSGTRIATVSTDGTVGIWNAVTGARLHSIEVYATSVVFSPDGATLLTPSSDGAQLWDVASAALLRRFGELLGPRSSTVAAFSPDGSRVVTFRRGQAVVWDTVTGEVSARLELEGDALGSPTHVAFSPPDGSRIAAGTYQGSRMWDAETGKLVTPWSRDRGVLDAEGPVGWVAFSPDGRRVVTARAPGARVWDVETGAELGQFGKHAMVQMVEFSPDGKRLVTAADNGKARIWNVAERKNEHELAHGDEKLLVNSARFSNDGTRVVTGAADGRVRIFDAGSGDLLRRIKHERPVASAMWSRDDAFILSASLDETARTWDVAPAPGPHRLRHEEDWVLEARFTPDATKAVSMTRGAVFVWDVESGRRLHELKTRASLYKAELSSDGTQVVATDENGDVAIWNVASGELLQQVSCRKGSYDAAFSPDGSRVVTACNDDYARVWDVGTGRPITPELRHSGPVYGVAFSPDGKRVVTFDQKAEGPEDDPAAAKHYARVWNAESGDEVLKLAHGPVLESASYSRDGKRIVVSTTAGLLYVWDAVSGDRLLEIDSRAPDGWLSAVSVSPDGTTLVTSAKDGNVRIWDMESGRERGRMLISDEGAAMSLAFSPDGSRLALGSMLGVMAIYDTSNWRQLFRISGHGQGAGELLPSVSSVEFSADGSLLISGSYDHTARIWPLTRPGLHRIVRARSRACLEPEYRESELAEDADVAHERYDACELAEGREPADVEAPEVPGE
jgi:WD40 repeat protein